MPLEQRWDILNGLVSHSADREDHNLPLMYWYAAEPLAELDPDKALELAAGAKVPLLRYMARRVAEIRDGRTPKELDRIVGAILKHDDDEKRLALLDGIDRGLRGQRRLKSAAGWDEAFAKLRESQSAAVR